MEANKHESNRCIDIAITALSSGNLERAEKFLRKAENLYPSQRAKELLVRIKSHPASNSTKSDNGSARKRTVPPHEQPHEPATADYTKEQLEMVKNIKKCKDYYEVLGVTKEATDSELKKAYKKMALQLHPDKNKAPGSVEAFKAVGNAVSVLTDPEKRKSYDLYGGNDQIHSGGRSQSHSTTYENGYGRGFESDITADELFNMFFGSGFHQQNMNTRQRRYQRNENQNQHQQQPSLAFGLILVLVVVSLMSSLFTSDPIYSLQPNSKYNMKRKTTQIGIPYYVKDNFLTEYQGSIERLENSVEEEYIVNMKQNCYRERNYRDAMMARARSFGSKSQFAQAQALKVPSCDNLYRIEQMTY